MRAFTDARTVDTRDEIWLLEHEPVYTLGLGGRPEHILDAGVTPVVRSDRGGQVTYHGPGQLMAYLLLDLKRLHMSKISRRLAEPQILVVILLQVGKGVLHKQVVVQERVQLLKLQEHRYPHLPAQQGYFWLEPSFKEQVACLMAR